MSHGILLRQTETLVDTVVCIHTRNNHPMAALVPYCFRKLALLQHEIDLMVVSVQLFMSPLPKGVTIMLDPTEDAVACWQSHERIKALNARWECEGTCQDGL